MTRPRLKRVDPLRRPGPFSRAFARATNNRLARFVSRHVNWYVDRWLLRVSGGRLKTGVSIPMALLETRGAKTGLPRRNAVIYFHDGDDVIVLASQAGAPENPNWYYNLRANPDVSLNQFQMRASVVTDAAELERLWQLATNVFAPFAEYRVRAGRAGRTIPIITLTPR